MKQVANTYHIAGNTVIQVTNKTAYLIAAVLSAVDVGTDWNVGVRDKQATPMYAVPPVTPPPQAVESGGRSFVAPKPMIMQNGIEIVSAGTTPGIVDLWLWYEVQP